MQCIHLGINWLTFIFSHWLLCIDISLNPVTLIFYNWMQCIDIHIICCEAYLFAKTSQDDVLAFLSNGSGVSQLAGVCSKKPFSRSPILSAGRVLTSESGPKPADIRQSAQYSRADACLNLIRKGLDSYCRLPVCQRRGAAIFPL